MHEHKPRVPTVPWEDLTTLSAPGLPLSSNRAKVSLGDLDPWSS